MKRRVVRERDRVERTEKQASLGVLSAGIAMAMNPLLGAILEETDAGIEALQRGGPSRRVHGHLHAIRRSVLRAGAIAGQLRDAAAASPSPTQRVDLSEFLLTASDCVESLAERRVEVDWHLARNGPVVMAGRLQLQAILLCLVTNAAEAIGGKGRIAISSGTLQADRELLERTEGFPAPVAGAYAFLRVSDDGHGIDAATRARIFDPFFTTRYAGRGLGLAALLGILRELRCVVHVESRPGEGTTFTVLFPAPPSADRPQRRRDAALTTADRSAACPSSA